MIYKTLKDKLDKLTQDQLHDDVSIRIDGEIYPVKNIIEITEGDILNKGHIVLIV